MGKQKIVLDTHVLIWMLGDPKRLTKKAQGAIRNARESGGLIVAAITLWELALLAERKRIEVAGTVEAFVRDMVSRVILRPLTPEITALAARLPQNYPRDPADRLIGSTAIIEGLPLVTADERIRDSKVVQTIW